eukprot:2388147-Pleurochrysis_carterae.AAC.1
MYVGRFLSADKKGVEANRGCGPCAVWCAFGRHQQHALPWGANDVPPSTFAEFALAPSATAA